MIKRLIAFAQYPPSRVVGIAFAGLSFQYGSLFSRLPEIQKTLVLTQAQVGLALLGLSIGSLLITPLSAWITNRYTVGHTAYWGTLLISAAFLTPLLSHNLWTLFLSLCFIGIGHGMMNVTLNAAAVAIEKTTQQPIISYLPWHV